MELGEHAFPNQLRSRQEHREDNQFLEGVGGNGVAHLLTDDIPATTGAVARVEIRTSCQSNRRLDVSANASKTDETTRNMEASFVNALPLRPFARRKMKTSGPESAAIPPSNPPQKPAPRPTGPIIRCLTCSFGASS